MTPPDLLLYGGIAGIGFGLVTVLLLLVPRGERLEQLGPADRVAAYTARTAGLVQRSASEPEGSAEALDQAKAAASGMLSGAPGLEDRIAKKLEGAGSALKPAEWLLVHLGVFLGAGLVGLLLGRGSLVLGLLFLLLGAAAPWVYLGAREGSRRRSFNAALPDTLQLISGSLSAGLSLAQSVDTIVREGQEPMVTEFRRAIVETRLGLDLEDALEGIADRLQSKDFAWVVMAVRIQRQVGGNLAELLETVAGTMRERQYLRRQVASLSAEGRLSCYVLSSLPPLFLGYLALTNWDYVSPLFLDPRGWILLGGATVWLLIGVFWMFRMVRMEV